MFKPAAFYIAFRDESVSSIKRAIAVREAQEKENGGDHPRSLPFERLSLPRSAHHPSSSNPDRSRRHGSAARIQRCYRERCASSQRSTAITCFDWSTD
jgi:hypothetical protein